MGHLQHFKCYLQILVQKFDVVVNSQATPPWGKSDSKFWCACKCPKSVFATCNSILILGDVIYNIGIGVGMGLELGLILLRLQMLKNSCHLENIPFLHPLSNDHGMSAGVLFCMSTQAISNSLTLIPNITLTTSLILLKIRHLKYSVDIPR